MTITEENKAESRPFEAQPFQADVAKLLHLMVHSVYSDKSVFLRELIANAADACERLRYESIANPALLGDDVKPRITLSLDADKRLLTVEDNGIGMSRDELAEALGTIARSGTRAFLDRMEAAQGNKAAEDTDSDRPIRRRLLFGLHRGGPCRCDFAPRRVGHGLAVEFRRQGHVHDRRRRAGGQRRAAARASCCI